MVVVVTICTMGPVRTLEERVWQDRSHARCERTVYAAKLCQREMEESRRTWLALPSLLKPMDVLGTTLRLMLRLVDIGWEVASVSMPRPRCEVLKFRLSRSYNDISSRTAFNLEFCRSRYKERVRIHYAYKRERRVRSYNPSMIDWARRNARLLRRRWTER